MGTVMPLRREELIAAIRDRLPETPHPTCISAPSLKARNARIRGRSRASRPSVTARREFGDEQVDRRPVCAALLSRLPRHRSAQAVAAGSCGEQQPHRECRLGDKAALWIGVDGVAARLLAHAPPSLERSVSLGLVREFKLAALAEVAVPVWVAYHPRPPPASAQIASVQTQLRQLLEHASPKNRAQGLALPIRQRPTQPSPRSPVGEPENRNGWFTTGLHMRRPRRAGSGTGSGSGFSHKGGGSCSDPEGRIASM